MKRSSPLRNPSIVLALVVLALMPAYPQTTLAQQQQTPPTKLPANPRERAKIRTLVMVETINQRAHELGLVSVTDDPHVAEFIRKRMVAQLTEDFEKLYSFNVDKIATQSSPPSLDYKAIADVTGDLKNRATRIKYNVALLQIAAKGEKIRYDENPDHLASMLPELSALIDSFLGSPVFRTSSPNDLELRRKASHDLESIIKLSETINKIAKRSTKIAAAK